MYKGHTTFCTHFSSFPWPQCAVFESNVYKFNAPAHVQLFPVLSVWVLSSWAHRGSCGSLPLGSWDPVQCRSHPAPSKCLPTHCTGHYRAHCTKHCTAHSTIILHCSLFEHCIVVHWYTGHSITTQTGHGALHCVLFWCSVYKDGRKAVKEIERKSVKLSKAIGGQ